MKEELQSKLVEILTSIQTATGKAADFAVEQLPDIAQSYVVYGRVHTTTCVVSAVLIFGALVWVGNRYSKPSEGMSWLGAAFGAVVPFLTVLFNFSDMLLVWFAPKVWLLKELAQLAK